MPYCNCSNNNLTPFLAKKCGDNFGAPQVMALVNMDDQPTDLSLLAKIIDKSEWTAALSPQSGTAKVALTPLIYDWSATPGGEVRWGEDADPDHVGIHVRNENTTATATFRRIETAIEASLQANACLAEAKKLGVYLFTADGRVVGVDGTTKIDPIPCLKFFVGDRSPMAGDEPDSNALEVAFRPGWSNNLKSIELTKNGAETENWRGADLLV